MGAHLGYIDLLFAHIVYEMPLKLKLNMNQNMTQQCAMLICTLSTDLQISMGRINLKYGQITMYNLIWNYAKGFPL